VELGTPRKRKASSRRTKPKRRRRVSVWLIVGLAALITGFLARRIMLPSAMRHLAHRAPDHPPSDYREPVTEQSHRGAERSQPQAGNSTGHLTTTTIRNDTAMKSKDNTTAAPADAGTSTGQSNPAHSSESEHISASDRQRLDSILKRNAK